MFTEIVDSQSSSSSSSPPKMLTPGVSSKIKKRVAGRKVFKETRHPVYRGVRQKNAGKWVCEVREPNKKARIWLGTFPTPETAALAHDVAVLALRGDNAPLNFPDYATWLPRAQSSSHQDIRKAACQAATDFAAFRVSNREEVSEMCDHVVYKSKDVVRIYVDEEEMFNMPVLLDSMAEGMLLTPLAMKKGFNWSQYEVDDAMELTLWVD